MKLKVLFFALFSIVYTLAYSDNFKIVLNGFLLDVKGNGVDNKIIYFKVTNENGNVISESKILTLGQGLIRHAIELSDTIKNGILIIKFEDCNGKEKVYEIKFIKGNALAGLKLQYCESVLEKCGLVIHTKKINDTSAIAVAVHRGKAPFKTKWSTGIEGDTLRYNPLIDSKYCAVSKDSTGCESEACIVILKPCASVVIARKINDSSAMAYVLARGTGKISHTWNTGQIGDTIRFDPRNKNKICVTSKDSIGCISESCISLVLEKCVAGIERSNNSLIAYLKNDIAKSYAWSTGSEKQSITIKDTGTYCVRIIGITGCISEACFRVKELVPECEAELVLDSLGSDTNAPGVKLKIKASYNLKYIEWNTGEKSQTIIARKTGEYCVTISDLERCKHYLCKKVELGSSEPTKCTLAIVQEKVPATANKDSAKLKLSFKFSSTAKIIVWSTGETTESIFPTKSGEYCVTVSDGVNCKQITCVKVEIPGTTVPPANECNARISVKPISNKEVQLTGKFIGSSPISFEWSTGSKESIITIKQTGTYCLTMKDGSGCTSKACIDVEIVAGEGLHSPTENAQKQNISDGKIVLDLFPNPSVDKVRFSYSTIKNEDAHLNIINLYGKKVYEEKLKMNEGKSIGELDISFLAPGIYQMIIDQKGTMVAKKLIVGK